MITEPLIRISLSPPDVGAEERELLLEAFDSSRFAPLGPHGDAFERELAAYVGAPRRRAAVRALPRCTWACSCTA